jgi:hypothetical protein
VKNFKQWLYCAGIRCVKTIAQTAVGMLTGNMVGIMDVDWLAVASVSVMAGVVSLLTSIAGLPELKAGDDNG